MGRLSGRAALVTADENGLAPAVAAAFGREGASVAIADAREERLESALRVVADTGVQCLGVRLNPVDPASCEQAVAKVLAVLGRLDVLANLAGEFPRTGPLHEIDEATWDRAVAANVRSVLLVSRYAVPALRQSGGTGSIINLSHVAALNGVPGTSVLAATKGALINMTRDMAIQGQREGFRVNCVCIGSTFVPVIPSLLAEHAAHPISPTEIAPTFVYLASDDSAHLNGHILNVDDGMHAWRQP